jgi:hypothetical protein
VSGSGQVVEARLAPQSQAFRLELAEPARVRLNTHYYPGWVVSVDGSPRAVDYENPQGLMELSLPAGSHTLQARFEDTPVRRWSTVASLVALLLLASLPLARRWAGRWVTRRTWQLSRTGAS